MDLEDRRDLKAQMYLVLAGCHLIDEGDLGEEYAYISDDDDDDDDNEEEAEREKEKEPVVLRSFATINQGEQEEEEEDHVTAFIDQVFNGEDVYN